MGQHLFVRSCLGPMFLAGIAYAQLGNLEECLPIPSYGSELRSYAASLNSPNREKIRIRSVSWEIAGNRLEGKQALLARRFLHLRFADEAELRRETESRTLLALQQLGYFKAQVSSQTRAAPGRATVHLTLIVDPGHRYNMGDLDFKGAKRFKEGELRSLFSLRAGEVFNTDKVRLGLENLRMFYGRHGFISMVPAPEVSVDEVAHLISLSIDVSEGPQYRFGELEVAGLDGPSKQRILNDPEVQPGKIFDYAVIEKLFRRYKSLLPSDADPARDSKTLPQTDRKDPRVDLKLDFRRCTNQPAKS